MAKPISTLLLTLILMPTVRPLSPLLEYVLNYDLIVKNFCIDRDKTESHCNGKCYVTKRLKEVNNDNAPSTREYPVQLSPREYSPVLPEKNCLSLSPSGKEAVHVFYYSFISKEFSPSLPTPPPKAFLFCSFS